MVHVQLGPASLVEAQSGKRFLDFQYFSISLSLFSLILCGTITLSLGGKLVCAFESTSYKDWNIILLFLFQRLDASSGVELY